MKPIVLSVPGTTITQAQLKCSIFNGTIASAISDPGATSTAGAHQDPFHPAHTKSTKTFILPTGRVAQTSTVTTLLINTRQPANLVNILPHLTQTLLSGSKFTDTSYTAVYNSKEVHFYDSSSIHIPEDSVLRGYRCPHTGLWHIPLQPIVLNENEDTLLPGAPEKPTSHNPCYKLPSTHKAIAHLQSIDTWDALANVYELPSIAKAVWYLHGAAGFPTKYTWLAAIRNGN
jgi:hypothetical protein